LLNDFVSDSSFSTTKYLWPLAKVHTIVSLTIGKNILRIQGVFKQFFKTVNFKGFSSALEKSKLIQVVFKEFKE
jgi:hypothetical protein